VQQKGRRMPAFLFAASFNQRATGSAAMFDQVSV
jgi:hypothetical protein